MNIILDASYFYYDIDMTDGNSLYMYIYLNILAWIC